MSVLLSVVVHSETLLMKDMSKGLDHARWIIELTGERSFVKDTNELINDSIRAYANDKLLPTTETLGVPTLAMRTMDASGSGWWLISTVPESLPKITSGEALTL